MTALTGPGLGEIWDFHAGPAATGFDNCIHKETILLMMNRREALLGLSAAALGASVTSASPLLAVAAGTPTKTVANEAVDERLRKDIDRLSPRVNSEEGVPVFLACVNLVGKAAPAALTPLNAAVAAEFRRDAAAWERIRPNSPETEVGKLIEVLAYRDFSGGGTEPAS
jgi:hypothetical protein